jgi:phage tail sheath protein FI
MNESIFATNTQGFNPASQSWGFTAYADAIDILSNKDQYDINLLFTPGLIDNLNGHGPMITRGINMCEDRGDVFYVIDPTYKGSTVGQATLASDGRNTNYAAYYYPWCQVADPDLGRNVWLPPSTVVSGVYSFNDLVKHPWYAPAGLNRGTLDTVIQTERLMTQNDRDNLYIKSVNPIASFPREGICVWGQKTLQKKQSALDRINVRRLLIDAKRFVAQTVKYLVFENNTVETRALFTELTDPYFRRVQNQQGLYDYRIIIDESNNTPDVIDRNEMRCQIYLKPAKTAEFIIVDFVVLPTGALFPTDTNE